MFYFSRWRLSLLLLALGHAQASTPDKDKGECAKLLAWCKLQESRGFLLQDGKVYFNGTRVTGSQQYPLAMVLRHLGLSAGDALRFKGRNVLSIAEGMGDLADYFHKNGARVQAVDLMYKRTDVPVGPEGEQIRAYEKAREGRLLQGDATKLPIADKSQRLVVSHALVNNLTDMDVRRQVVSEAVRVLEPGGEARIYGFAPNTAKQAKNFLEAKYGKEIQVETAVHSLPQDANVFEHNNILLTVHRLSPINESPWQSDD